MASDIDYSKIKYTEHWARKIFTLFLHPLDGYYFDRDEHGIANLVKVDRKWLGRWLGYNTEAITTRIEQIEPKIPFWGGVLGYRNVLLTTSSGDVKKLNYIRKKDLTSFKSFGKI